MQETWVWSLGMEDLLEKEMATHSGILAWRIPCRMEPGGLQVMGSRRVGHDWSTNTHISIMIPTTTLRFPRHKKKQWERTKRKGRPRDRETEREKEYGSNDILLLLFFRCPWGYCHSLIVKLFGKVSSWVRLVELAFSYVQLVASWYTVEDWEHCPCSFNRSPYMLNIYLVNISL